MKPIVQSLLHSKDSLQAAGQMSARSVTQTSPNAKLSIKPLSLREMPNWILALAFLICAASGFERPWITDAPLSDDFQLLQMPVPQPPVLMNLSFQWPAWMTSPSSSGLFLHTLQRKVVRMPRTSLPTGTQNELDSQTCDVLRLNRIPASTPAKTVGGLKSC